MAGKKYLSDYSARETVLANGAVRKEYDYTGSYFRFTQEPSVVARLRRLTLICCCADALLLLPLLFTSTVLGRRIWTVLPAVASFVPIWLLLSAAWGMGDGTKRLTREQRDKTDYRLHSASMWLCLLLGAAFLGAAASLILESPGWEELACTLCLLAAAVLAVLLWRRRDDASTCDCQADA